jgi:hypothetical protein
MKSPLLFCLERPMAKNLARAFPRHNGNLAFAVVMPALVAGIHVFATKEKRGWPGQARP